MITANEIRQMGALDAILDAIKQRAKEGYTSLPLFETKMSDLGLYRVDSHINYKYSDLEQLKQNGFTVEEHVEQHGGVPILDYFFKSFKPYPIKYYSIHW